MCFLGNPMEQFLWIWMWSHQHKPDVRLQRTWYKGGGPRGTFYLQPHLIPLLHKRPLKCVCCICGNPLEEKVNEINPDWLVNSWELLGQQRPTWVPVITSACSWSWNLGVPSRRIQCFQIPATCRVQHHKEWESEAEDEAGQHLTKKG